MKKEKSKKSTYQKPVYSKFEVKQMIGRLRTLMKDRNHSEFAHYEKMLARYESILKQMEGKIND